MKELKIRTLLKNPNAVRVEEGSVKIENGKVNLELKPHSVNVVKIWGEKTI